MDKNNYYIGKSSKRLLLPGLRFHPTDEEVLFEYLRCKVFCLPLPASVIREIDFLNFAPWHLPGNGEEMRYFFNKKEANKVGKQKKTQMVNGRGYWKASGSTKRISPSLTPSCMGVGLQGSKKSFVFYEGNAPKGRRTNWFMHEYSLDFDRNEVDFDVEDWVVCNVFLKQGSELVRGDSSPIHEDQYSDNFYSNTDSMNNVGSPTYYCHSPASSSSSVYRNSSPYETNYDEGSSYYSP